MRRSLSTALALVALLAVAATPVVAQQHQHGAKADTGKAKTMKHDMAGGHDMKGHMASPWKEMDAFHAVLGGTFHPAADKGDFAPLKANAQALADKAAAWAASTAPAACATEANKQAVAKVASSTSDLAAKVKSGAADAELKAAITAIHDTFETVEHACPPGGMKGMKH
jgi:hypothetical protein